MTRTVMRTTFGVFIVLGMALAAASGCNRGGEGDQGRVRPGRKGGDEPTSSGQTRREYAVPVGVTKLVRGPISEYVSIVGTVAPGRSLPVKSEDSGRIHFVKEWREGEPVKQGQLMARLDEAETSRMIEISRADLETARSQLGLALKRLERNTMDYERARAMYSHGQIAGKMVEEREFQANLARIQYEEAILSVQKAETRLEQQLFQGERKVVVAPMTGYLVTRGAMENRANAMASDSAEAVMDQEGRLIGTGQTICGVVDVSKMLIRCDVTSKDIIKVRKEQDAKAFVYTDRELPVDGKVIDVSPVMDMQTRAFKADVLVDNKDGILRPGMFARVNIIIKTHLDAVVVNRKVLQRRNNEDIVFVVGEEDRAERRIVKLGLDNPDEVEVVEGLRNDERLITLGYETLQDKIKVKIIESESETGVAGEANPTSATTVSKAIEKKA